MGARRDLVGHRVGRITAIRCTGQHKGTTYVWECVCDCGTPMLVAAAALTRKHKPTRSCGCYTRDRLRETHALPPGAAKANAYFKGYARDAMRRGYGFCLTREEFDEIISQPCLYCGAAGPNGIDRQDNKTGYTLANSYPCCKQCNVAKGAQSLPEFLAWIRRLITWHG